ncbi:MAG TPA: DUF4097 family beta strand repeat-containing protein [Vicinamibacterales bacterium]|nr:DUF4097 family beta strand repeat-containing protein [Vicinamibacterales bacterium]
MKMPQISTCALAGLLAVAGPALAQQETERVDRTASIRAGGELRIRNFSGTVTITASRRGDIAIQAIRRAPRERLENIKLEVRETGSGVTIEANRKSEAWRDRDDRGRDRSDVVETQLDIQVPEDVTLDVDVFSSDIRVSGVTGRQKLHTFSGDIEVTGATGSIEAETFSGDIELTLAQGAGGRVDFDSFSGSLRSDVDIATRSSRRNRVSGTIGSGGGNDYRFKTFSGDARIR